MKLQNLNEIRDKLFYEIKELVSELVPIESAKELGNCRKKIQILYDKAIFLEKLYEEDIFLKQENSIQRWESFSNISANTDDYSDFVVNKKQEKKEEISDISDLVVEEVKKLNDETKIIDEVEPEQKIKLESIKNVKSIPLDQKVKNSIKDNKNILNLDLNDRITFLKMLFSGDEVEMTVTLNKLYNSKTLLDANEYLSEVYHDRNWSSVDEYAQRLWALVERKF